MLTRSGSIAALQQNAMHGPSAHQKAVGKYVRYWLIICFGHQHCQKFVLVTGSSQAGFSALCNHMHSVDLAGTLHQNLFKQASIGTKQL